MQCSNIARWLCTTLITGIAIGSVLGILYAPARGSETRRRLSCKTDKTDTLTDSLKEKFDEIIEEIQKDVDAAKGRQSDLV